MFVDFFPGRSLMVKKNDGIKESTDSSTTLEDEDTKGGLSWFIQK